jgi:hyperosmotically inducible protein
MKALWSSLALAALVLTPVGFWRVASPAVCAAADADNSEKNVRDRGGKTLTPMDQGGSEADRTITQEIRKAVVANDDFSTDAKNVKIITVAGVVTLRGPVKNANERTSIGNIAQQTAGVKRVDNQLEIAATHRMTVTARRGRAGGRNV